MSRTVLHLWLVLLAATSCCTPSAVGAEQLAPSSAKPWAAVALPVEGVTGVSGLRVTDAASGARIDVYFERAARATVEAALPRLLATLRADAESFGVPAAQVEWFSVQFTHDPKVSAALRARSLGMWRVPVDAAGQLGAGRGLEDGRQALQIILPHEQAHAVDSQIIRPGDMPWWWIEGIATWVENRVRVNVYQDHAGLAAQRARRR